MKKYHTWIIHDNSVVVPCRLYTWGSLALCGLLVIGGLAVGFPVGERIHGVDPFNISVFCWVLAGFPILVTKATRVENWPCSWFLRGEVPCRSVTEVVAVTGVDAQILIAILLRLDEQTYLRNRGPFNVLFSRKTEEIGGGFSIDVPIKVLAAMEGGLIPVKVLGQWGIGLAFVSARSWGSYQAISNFGVYEDQAICRDLAHTLSVAQSQPSHRLTMGNMAVSRVLGIFQTDCYFF
ncbi:hypothetical protein LY78DRAFT_593094 [Colletotrichum sublineola]|nr:hypothetical protein LY78DRAFT_593094 [Colletotrichum sublineola]